MPFMLNSNLWNIRDQGNCINNERKMPKFNCPILLIFVFKKTEHVCICRTRRWSSAFFPEKLDCFMSS